MGWVAKVWVNRNGLPMCVGARDITLRVDTRRVGRKGARDVNDREAALVEKKTMGSPGRVIIVTHDVPLQVDSDGDRGYGSRRVNNGLVRALVEQEAMGAPCRGVAVTHDVTLRVDTTGSRLQGAGHIKGAKRASMEQEAMVRSAPANKVGADDVTLRVDTKR